MTTPPTQPHPPQEPSAEAMSLAEEVLSAASRLAYPAATIERLCNNAIAPLRAEVARLTGELAKAMSCPHCRGEIGVILTTVADQEGLRQRLASVERERDELSQRLDTVLTGNEDGGLQYWITKYDLSLLAVLHSEQKAAQSERELALERQALATSVRACEAVEAAHRESVAIGDLIGSQLEASAEDCLREHERANKAEAELATAQQAQRDTAARAGMAEELAGIVEQSENTIRSLVGALATIDSDERFRARAEKRDVSIHTVELAQSEKQRLAIAAILRRYAALPKGRL